MPLPAASAQNELSNHPDMSELPKIKPRLLQKNVTCEQCDNRTMPAR